MGDKAGDTVRDKTGKQGETRKEQMDTQWAMKQETDRVTKWKTNVDRAVQESG